MTTLTVHGMSCDGCEEIVEDALEEVDGVESATADREGNTAEVTGEAETEALLDAVDFAGYEGALPDGEAGDAADGEETDEE